VSKKELQKEYEAVRGENIALKEENGLLKKMLFGAKRERFISDQNPMQTSLFGLEEQEAAATTQQVEETEEVVVRKKKKTSRKKPQRNRFPESLERETTILQPTGIDLEGFTQIGTDVTELLSYRPASLYVKQIIRPRLVDKKNEDKGVLQAPIPPRIVPKGMVDESLIAEIINEKIQFHTPVHRFSKKVKQAGVDFISENNLYNWFHTGAASLIPIYDLLIKDILSQDYIQGDETRMQVLKKNKPGASHRGQMWAFMAPTIKAVAFNYEPTRSGKSANIILEHFSGKLQVDGYTVYDAIGKRKDIDLSFCMAHSRRKFYDAKDIAPDIANYVLEKVQVLYALEEHCRKENFNFQQRLHIRQEKAVPILKELEKYLMEKSADRTILPKSLIRRAIDYALPRWKGLSAYAHDGELEIDNNLVENTIRPIALGRKNYMFAGSDEGAQHLAVLYSIIGTCLKNNINAYHYLHWLLKKVAANKITEEAVEWLPHRIGPEILEKFEAEVKGG
jgi:transposase